MAFLDNAPKYDKIRLSYSYNLNFPMFDRTVFFRLVASRKATPFGGGQERNAICEENRESGSMHPLSERDRAKKDYGKVEIKTKKAIQIFLRQLPGEIFV